MPPASGDSPAGSRGRRASGFACFALQQPTGQQIAEYTQPKAIQVGAEQQRIFAVADGPALRNPVQGQGNAQAQAGPAAQVKAQPRWSGQAVQDEYRGQADDHGAADGGGLEDVSAGDHWQVT